MKKIRRKAGATSKTKARPVVAVVVALSRGRQRKGHVVLVDCPPGRVDAPARRAGTAEGDPRQQRPRRVVRPAHAQRALHDHLGACSAIGVKIGLRAAELLDFVAGSTPELAH